MREAIGGIFSLTLLATFLVIISSIIAFSLSYSKALRMKEYAINQYEKQECQTIDDFWESVRSEASRIGYSSSISSCDSNALGCQCQYGVCVKTTAYNTDVNGYKARKGEIVTYAGINLPFLNQIFPLLKFKIVGTSNSCFYSG